MTDTIDQKEKIFNRWIDTIGGQHDQWNRSIVSIDSIGIDPSIHRRLCPSILPNYIFNRADDILNFNIVHDIFNGAVNILNFNIVNCVLNGVNDILSFNILNNILNRADYILDFNTINHIFNRANNTLNFNGPANVLNFNCESIFAQGKDEVAVKGWRYEIWS